MPDALSPPLLLVLRHLDRTDSQAVLRVAVKELIRRQVLLVHEAAGLGPRGRRTRRLVLLEGPASPPDDALLGVVARAIAQVPTETADGRVVRDVAVVARHLARQKELRRHVVQAALAQLAEDGLVTRAQRPFLLVFSRRRHLRTPAGEALTARSPALHKGHPATDSGVAAVAGGQLYDTRMHDGRLPEDPTDEEHTGSAADPRFDSEFDAGFSSGDGGGGGGSGGGGAGSSGEGSDAGGGGGDSGGGGGGDGDGGGGGG